MLKLGILLILAALVATMASSQRIHGINYVGYNEGCYDSDVSDQLMTEMATTTGANWVSIYVRWVQENISSTVIYYPAGKGPDRDDIVHAVQKAQSLGLRVALKPHVDLVNDPSHWRGQIGQDFTQVQWQQWFDSYTQYMRTMASLASGLNVDLFIIGTELSATESQESLWRGVIAEVRARFRGTVVYGANHGGIGWDNVKWWDALDFIGLDAYYPLSNVNSPTVSQLIQGWKPWVVDIERLAKEWNRTVIFTEVGYQSRVDAAQHPWASSGALSMDTQANCYEALFEVMNQQPWFAGSIWWAWTTDFTEGGVQDSGFTPRSKPAAQILKKWSGSSRKPRQGL